jgi:ABC-type maltose transport system permease subunit
MHRKLSERNTGYPLLFLVALIVGSIVPSAVDQTFAQAREGAVRARVIVEQGDGMSEEGEGAGECMDVGEDVMLDLVVHIAGQEAPEIAYSRLRAKAKAFIPVNDAILSYLAQTLPVALYMLANYFRTIPAEIEQAGLIDGCSRLGVIWRITLPLAVPALVSVAIYTFMIAWNEFLYALVFLNDRRMFTMPIQINTIFNDPTPRPHVVMAASTIMTLPVVALFLALERFLEEGLSAGGVKG